MRGHALLVVGVVTLVTSPVLADAPWQRYRDPASGVSISHPPGWTAERHGYTLVVRSSDHASLVLVSGFQHGDGETAAHYLRTFAADNTTLFPQGKIEGVQPQTATAGDEVVASLPYKGRNGAPGLARVLCLVAARTGFVFAVAAPSKSMAAEAPMLVKILTSFAFESGPAPSSANSGAASLHFQSWTDPLQNAFTVEVPSGWKVSGGTYQLGLTDYRRSVVMGSPGGDVAVLCGDASISGFREPNALSAQLHQQEGSKISLSPGRDGMLLHYLPAQQFNQEYVTRRLSNVLNNVMITSQQDLPDVAAAAAQESQTATDNVQPGAMHFDATAARATFTGTYRDSGQPAAGILQSFTRLATGMGQYAGVARSWDSSMSVCLYPAGAEAQDQPLCVSILDHYRASTRINQAWQNEKNRVAMQLSLQQQQAINQMMNENAQRFMENTVRSGEAFRAQLQANGEAFRAHQEHNLEVRSANTERWCDYLLDRQKMVNPETGEVSKVSSANFHYQQGGTIINSDVPLTFPDVNFNPVLLNAAPYTPHP